MKPEPVPYTLERRKRKTVAITVAPDGSVVVKAPPYVSRKRIDSFVAGRRVWIERCRERYRRHGDRVLPRRYVPGEVHYFLGEPYRLRIETAGTSRPRVTIADGDLVVFAADPADREAVERAVRRWYRSEAIRVFTERIEVNRARFRDPEVRVPSRLTVRWMRTRWGSMTSKGRLTLAIDLVTAPVEAIDYVITHELCHMTEMNHGPAFHALQQSVLPDWRARKAQLAPPRPS